MTFDGLPRFSAWVDLMLEPTQETYDRSYAAHLAYYMLTSSPSDLRIVRKHYEQFIARRPDMKGTIKCPSQTEPS